MPLPIDSNPPNTTKVNWTIKDAIFILIIQYVFIFFLSLLFLKKMKENPYIGAFFVSIFTIILISFLLFRRKEKWSSLGFVKKDNGKMIIKGILFGVVLFFLTKLFFNYFSFGELYIDKFNFIKVLKTFLLIITFKGFNHILLTPFIEEIIDRGLLYQAIQNKFNKWQSIIIVSILSSVLHFSSFAQPNWLMIRFIYGLSLTYLFDRYKNLSITIACHSTLNYIPWAIWILKEI